MKEPLLKLVHVPGNYTSWAFLSAHQETWPDEGGMSLSPQNINKQRNMNKRRWMDAKSRTSIFWSCSSRSFDNGRESLWNSKTFLCRSSEFSLCSMSVGSSPLERKSSAALEFTFHEWCHSGDLWRSVGAPFFINIGWPIFVRQNTDIFSSFCYITFICIA